jgi:hypothetical protein
MSDIVLSEGHYEAEAEEEYYLGSIPGFMRRIKPSLTNMISKMPEIKALRAQGCSHPGCSQKDGIHYCHFPGFEQERLVEDLLMKCLIPGTYRVKVPLKWIEQQYRAKHEGKEAAKFGWPLCRDHDTDGRRKARGRLE